MSRASWLRIGCTLFAFIIPFSAYGNAQDLNTAKTEPPIWQEGEREAVPNYPSYRKPTPYREGLTPKGNYYRYFRDGSGHVSPSSTSSIDEQWSVSCSQDAITDVKSCQITNFGTHIFISLTASLSISDICILNHDFPGRAGAIRVDSNRAFQTDTEGCLRSPALLAQLRSGSKVTTRRIQWPDDYPRDASGDLGSLDDAIALLSYVKKNIKM